MSYIVNCAHHRRCYRKGDLECETLSTQRVFKTRKEANEFLKEEAKTKGRNAFKVEMKIVARGEKSSELVVYTNDTWVHENTGDTHREYYWYTVDKLK